MEIVAVLDRIHLALEGLIFVGLLRLLIDTIAEILYFRQRRLDRAER